MFSGKCHPLFLNHQLCSDVTSECFSFSLWQRVSNFSVALWPWHWPAISIPNTPLATDGDFFCLDMGQTFFGVDTFSYSVKYQALLLDDKTWWLIISGSSLYADLNFLIILWTVYIIVVNCILNQFERRTTRDHQRIGQQDSHWWLIWWILYFLCLPP